MMNQFWNCMRLFVCIGAIATIFWISNAITHATPSRLTATVDYAKSGNTLELLPGLGPQLPTTTIRLAAIEAPDRDQTPWGEQARQCLSDLGNQIIYLESVDGRLDAYDRLWAYAWLGTKSINQLSLAEGCTYLATPDRSQGPRYQNFLYAQERARLLGFGIWDPAQPLRETAETFRERSHSP